MATESCKPLNLDKVLGKARNRISRIGCELEGGWKNLPAGVTLVRDGSVHLETYHDPRILAEMDALQQAEHQTTSSAQLTALRARRDALERVLIQNTPQIGELPSDPMELAKVPVWMKQYYPSIVNDTCGLHVHMSFQSPFHYARLMIPEFPLTMVEYISRWAAQERLSKDHPIWPRLAGASEFCQPVFDPIRQKEQTRKAYDRGAPGHRYTMINYCFGIHGTIECRLLPMMKTAEQGIRAVYRVIEITNASLSVQRQREKKLRGEVVMESGDDTVRERREVRI